MKPQPDSSLYTRRYAVLYATMLGSIMVPIDASLVNVILPTITQSFHTQILVAQWVPLIYFLTIASLLLFYGRLGDIIGYKRVYMAGLCGFIAASTLCSAATSIYALIGFRAGQGTCVGMMMAVSYAIITACFPPHERGKALGIYALSISAGSVIGLSLGGLISFTLGWRFAFLINVPIGIAAYFWTRQVIPDLKGQPGKLDVGGGITAFIGLASFLLFINRTQVVGLDNAAYLFFVVALVAGTAFIRLESRTSQPMLDLKLFRSTTFSLANISALLNFISQYIMGFITPFYLQWVLHQAPKSLGTIMTAFPLAAMCVAPLSGSLSDHFCTRIPAFLGASLCSLALFLMSLLPSSASPLDVAWRLALFGLGTGIFQSPNNSAVMGSVPIEHLGSASGVLATTRNVGRAFGTATASWVLYRFVSPDILNEMALDAQATAAFLAGVRHAYLAGALLTAIAALTSLMARHKKLKSASRTGVTAI